jgi:hypothetical protein
MIVKVSTEALPSDSRAGGGVLSRVYEIKQQIKKFSTGQKKNYMGFHSPYISTFVGMCFVRNSRAINDFRLKNKDGKKGRKGI